MMVRSVTSLARDAGDRQPDLLRHAPGITTYRRRPPIQIAGGLPGAVKEVEEAFTSADLLRAVRLLTTISNGAYRIKELFRDEQRKITAILKGTLADVESAYEEIYEPNVR
jgi:hypothetical protein